jgi:glycine cleavage system H protein
VANVPGDLLYTAEHEYIRDRGNGIVEVGITYYAQGEIGDVVYLELPNVVTYFYKHDVFGNLEWV